MRPGEILKYDWAAHETRYDSGIFVLQFMQTYDGWTIQNFSNLDVLQLRAKFLFQLLTSQHNTANSKFMKNFYRDNNSIKEFCRMICHEKNEICKFRSFFRCEIFLE